MPLINYSNVTVIGDFHNVSKFQEYPVNKWLFLTITKLAGACLTSQQLMYAKWIPATEITLKKAGEWNGWFDIFIFIL